MEKQIYNPFLPINVYIPDGEPHVFGNRVYLYGSHDKEGGDRFCMLDYEVWSAPISDLSDWTCEGIKTGIIFGYFLHCINFNNSKQLSES